MQLTKTFFISLLAITTWATVNCQQDEITGEEKYQPILYHRIGWMDGIISRDKFHYV